ncbi:family 43 glycosylhydrolase [Listeria ivanovii]|uniref:glycoside hydrolase family 43 protein n=1 Tax=Listeria ivanovii TaxID=1638 RepID=UPI001942CEF3|nr:family 43 glycosylhydrolase [Listeria ivanovii]MBM5607870.1 alpha-N-arabinofuranosidase [Listeria ivanovii]MBM5636115.1 alpha-N-arabinofuranosidase [Listeria ivanovii]MBM5705298.1 alpha-N-arabinofuranosidase [Listeria ivanovii]
MNKKATYKNPIVIERADPWVYKHTDGFYYFTGSVPGYQSIELRRAKNIDELGNGECLLVWQAPTEGPMSQLIWAPEIHYINERWYIYFAASDDEQIRDQHHHHRMFVIENQQADPMNTDWIEKGQIKTAFDSFSLDGTAFQHQNKLYYVWAQQDPRIPGNSNLYISEMENPWTLKGPQVLLSIPEFEWEKIGFSVNEGAAAIVRNGKVFITYSGSATDENYAIGLLWADENADLLNGYSWHKASEPVFVSSEKNKQFGPGHNSFTKSEDDQADVLVYHARPEKNKAGDPLDNPNRHANAQIFSWDEEGFPVFGEPTGYTRNMKTNE